MVRYFIKVWMFTSGFFCLFFVAALAESPEDRVAYFFVAMFMGLAFGTIIFVMTRPRTQAEQLAAAQKPPTPTAKPKKKVKDEYLVCPFCESSRLGERQVTVDNSTSNAMAGYMAFGKPGLIFGCMPDEVHKFLICYDCANEFSYDEALVAQEYDAS